jgi:hypothetical protein
MSERPRIVIAELLGTMILFERWAAWRVLSRGDEIAPSPAV